MYDELLLPVALDGVDDDPAVERALDLAARHDATLRVLSVVDSAVVEPLAVDNAAMRDSMEEQAEATVEAAADLARDRGVDVETHVGHGSPASVVTDEAAAADLVVMATHGREGLAHAFLGSITEKVIRTSPTPVLTIPR